MTLLAQISDLHIRPPGKLLLDRIDTAGYLERCVARLNALDPRPDAVIVTGDLVDQGAVDEYERLRALLAPLEIPAYLMMGNHDERGAFRSVFGDARYASGEFLQYAVDVGALRVIALDTNDPALRTGGGSLCARRREWLAAELAAARDREVVIAMHHPPFATGIEFMDGASLDGADAAAFAALVAAHPNVHRVICGHLHRPIQTRFAGTIASTVPSCAHQVALALLPGAPIALALEPPAFALHAWTPAGLVSHQVYIDSYGDPITL